MFLVQNYGPPRFWLREDLPEAGLANVAATLLTLLGLDAPEFYAPNLVEPIPPP
jgi:2,3-bisphosphoglycerate-independent phosphoglycerate mutase